MRKQGAVVLAVDIGSIPKGRLAWYSSTGTAGTSLDELARHLDGLLPTTPVALGFECPAWLPIPAEEAHLGSRRGIDPSDRAWSAGAGAGSLATGLAQIPWTLRQVAGTNRRIACTVRPDRWGSRRPLLLWEAMVTGPSKGKAHAADERAAVAAFDTKQRRPPRGASLKLMTVCAIWAGLGIKQDDLHEPVLVCAAT